MKIAWMIIYKDYKEKERIERNEKKQKTRYFLLQEKLYKLTDRNIVRRKVIHCSTPQTGLSDKKMLNY